MTRRSIGSYVNLDILPMSLLRHGFVCLLKGRIIKLSDFEHRGFLVHV